MSINELSQGRPPSDSEPTLTLITVNMDADLTPRAAELSHMSGYRTVIRGREKVTQVSITNNDTPIIPKNIKTKEARLIKTG